LLYEREIQDKRLLDAAMEASPEDGQTLLLIGAFSKKVLNKRKPRPHEIINGKPVQIKKSVADSTFDPTLANQMSHPNLS
jgi:hypothetical protein